MDPFQVIADPTRRKVIAALRNGEQPVGTIVDRIGIHQSGVSRHLAILTAAGFVAVRRDGARRIYALRREPFRTVATWLAQFLEPRRRVPR